MTSIKAILAAAVAAVGVISSDPADAKIRCQNGYQIVQGNPIATPYCQEAQLAEVARGYGFRVSFDEIRNNPNSKRRLCALIGRDIRVQQTCIDANITGRRGY
ncbi:MAG: hypothetical protein NW216_04250 [Hyphomicrobium sp.]|nr:hypothetical protein [Hyphomicrobium sp.]